MKQKHYVFLLIALLAFTLSACDSTPPPKEVTLLADDIFWSMEEIDVEAGQTLTLTIRNVGALDHNFVVEELGYDILLSPGESETISFVVDEAGRLEFICDIPGHLDAGMQGEIVVGEAR